MVVVEVGVSDERPRAVGNCASSVFSFLLSLFMMAISRVIAVGLIAGVLMQACIGDLSGAPSTARVWNEQTLSAIRLDRPHPAVHARNLFSVSIAMYDAWAAFDPVAVGYIYKFKHTASDLTVARREAISYAAYRILKERYALAIKPEPTLLALDKQMAALGYPITNDSPDPSTPAGIGNAIAAAVSNAFKDDGALQARSYKDHSVKEGGYKCANEPMVVGLTGTNVTDVNCWQPLAIANALDQNGNPTGPVQFFQGSQWLQVRTFALQRDAITHLGFDPGPPPYLHGKTDAQFRAELVDVIRRSSELTPDDGVVEDFSPGALGHNTLGANDGTGHRVNPATGQPYKSNRMKRGDFVRILAEFWADGPNSETPPGHWNVLANQVADHPRFQKRFGGIGPVLDDLEWDIKTYFVLNGALHDAACAAWSVKRFYDGWRPITAIRFMGQLGQCTVKGIPSYHPDGLPLIPSLIELVTPSSAKVGQRHEGLPPGAIALLTWPGQPEDSKKNYAGVKWKLAADWVPYQKKTFVTPAFPGYISGHSTFSRSAAEVLTALTGSLYFPGGMATHDAPAKTTLTFESGPTEDVHLQWATFYDAADQAGLSRIWGGIHVSADDLTGRRAGAQCGKSAWLLANKYFDGSIGR